MLVGSLPCWRIRSLFGITTAAAAAVVGRTPLDPGSTLAGTLIAAVFLAHKSWC